jgi:FAD/FMN-containing dehydrogenase
MSLQVDDILGLNPAELQAMPVVHDQGRMIALVKNCQTPVSITGSRHSQGGHTVFQDGTSLGTSFLSEPMNRVLAVDTVNKTVTAEAGATWNVLHAHLAPLGLAPRVQQSSPHFTLGGSISVNCHGRDPREGPLSNCIDSMKVLVPSSAQPQPVTVRPGEPLFQAVVGGYGSAAVILEATLKVTDNHVLSQNSQVKSLHEYAEIMKSTAASGAWTDLHYAWLNFSSKDLFKSVLMVDCARVTGSSPAKETQLDEDGWLEIELMRWLWEQHSKAADAHSYRDLVWDTLVEAFRSQNLRNKKISRIGWLRQSISFTAQRSQSQAGLLQEYFVPFDQFEPFVTQLRSLLQARDVNVLSSTVRIVQKEVQPCFLSYAPQQAMACIALDFESPLVVAGDGAHADRRMPSPATRDWVRAAIDLALNCGGSYYLPYYGFATPEQFKTAYPGWAQQKNSRDPKLNNLFLHGYL